MKLPHFPRTSLLRCVRMPGAFRIAITLIATSTYRPPGRTNKLPNGKWWFCRKLLRSLSLSLIVKCPLKIQTWGWWSPSTHPIVIEKLYLNITIELNDYHIFIFSFTFSPESHQIHFWNISTGRFRLRGRC